MFFIDKDTADGTEGRNIFISSTETDGRETVTSARSGRIEWVKDQQFLMLNNGQRLETAADQSSQRVSEFEEYGTQIGTSAATEPGAQALKARNSWDLITDPSAANLGELGWRIGMGLTSLNFVLIALATTTGNPRAGRGGNLFFTLFAFVFYYNLLNLGPELGGQRLVQPGELHAPASWRGVHAHGAVADQAPFQHQRARLDQREAQPPPLRRSPHDGRSGA